MVQRLTMPGIVRKLPFTGSPQQNSESNHRRRTRRKSTMKLPCRTHVSCHNSQSHMLDMLQRMGLNAARLAVLTMSCARLNDSHPML